MSRLKKVIKLQNIGITLTNKSARSRTSFSGQPLPVRTERALLTFQLALHIDSRSHLDPRFRVGPFHE